MLTRSAVGGFAAACLAVVLLAGCGERTLDTSRLETQIGKTLSDRTGFAIKSVDCPDNVKARQGERFDCTVTTGRNVRVRVAVNEDDDQGGVTWKLAGPLRR